MREKKSYYKFLKLLEDHQWCPCEFTIQSVSIPSVFLNLTIYNGY